MSYLFNSTGYPLYKDNIVKGAGCYVYDKDKNQYLDFEAGVWALSLGHCNPEINRAIHEQIDEIMHVGYKYNQTIAEKCAKKLLEIADMKEGKCVFLTSGSEAVEYGVQLAKSIYPNKKCLCLKDQYLSAYGHCYGKNTEEWELIEWDYGDQKSVNEWYDELSYKLNISQIGVFVFEPGNSSGTVKLPPNNLVRAISRIVEEHNIITVIDEVTCGIGRTGKWFGYMNYDIKADVIAVGKGIGNGYPVSAVIIEESIAKKAEIADFHFAQSHQNDPMGCRVVYEVIEKIERDDLLNHVNRTGEYLRNEFIKLQQEIPVISEIRGIGLLNCIEFEGSVSTEVLEQIDKMLFDRGIIVGVKLTSKIIRTYCPLIVTTEMIDKFISTLKLVLANVLLKIS
jgi:acetylornithine/N-succinyldiaminopimelate aminotransferase